MLKRVSIQNFKSLKDVTLDLQKVNLLIGPNNSGKTNFLKALEFCYQSLQHPNRVDVKEYANRLLFNLEPNDLVLEFILLEDEAYRVKIKDDVMSVMSRGFGWNLYNWVDHDQIQGEEGIAKRMGPVNELFSNSKIYRVDPNKLTQPGPVGAGEETVKADASNLVGFLDLMLGKYRKAVFNHTENDLNKCVPEFDEINLDDAPATDELKKQYGDKSFKKLGLTNSKQGITYWADELSEGTLYFLALLCIINQPNPPKLLLLEEPEKGIHPRRIREVMEFVRRLVAEKDIQVIMTTHSPLLLDEFAENTEGVFVFDKEPDGATTVRNLQRDVIEPANQERESKGLPPVPYTEALGEYWTIGFLGGVPHETN